MDNAGYAALTRQMGLQNEMLVIANNIANANTTGFKQEGILFSEYVNSLSPDVESLSMATARVRDTSEVQGVLQQTGGTYDVAIEGEGFFQIGAPDGIRLTRAGSFTPDANGGLVNLDGYPVLDAGGAPVVIPQGQGPIGIAADGSISAGGNAVGQIGLVTVADPSMMTRAGGVLFDPQGDVLPVENPRMVQGFLEQSNVNPILQMGRMVEVQRAYELGQSLLEQEDERIRSVIRAVDRN